MAANAVQGPVLEKSSPEPAPPWAVPSLAELYEQNLGYLWRCLRGLGVRDFELDDAIQDVFLVVQKRRSSFDGGVSPRTWLYAIAIRIARRYKERYQRLWRQQAASDEGTPELASPSNTEAEFDHGQRLALARCALSALDDDKREVFVLAQVEQMSAPEISQVTGLPINTVYSRLRAARGAFAAELSRLQAHNRRSP